MEEDGLDLATKQTEDRFKGCLGRIIRGQSEGDFEMLAEPARDTVFLLGPKGLAEIEPLSPYEKLLKIGYQVDYIKEKLADGFSFRLVVFPEDQGDLPCGLYTWDGVMEVVRREHPQAALCIESHLEALKTSSFEDIQALSDMDLAKVNQAGRDHEGFMTPERLEASAKSLFEARAFLYHTMQLRALYAGDGFTRTADGAVGVPEYFCPNVRLSQLSGVQVSKLDVQLPSSAI